MPDNRRRSPTIKALGSVWHRSEPTLTAFTDQELDRIFSAEPQSYQDFRGLVACVLVLSSGMYLYDTLNLTVHDLTPAHDAMFAGGGIFHFKTRSCYIQSWMKQRRYRPGVATILTSLWGKPVCYDGLKNTVYAFNQTPSLVVRLRLTYRHRRLERT